MSERFKKTDGSLTNDVEEYANDWMTLARGVAEILDCDVHGVDPEIQLVTKPMNGMYGKVFSIPLSVAKKIQSLPR